MELWRPGVVEIFCVCSRCTRRIESPLLHPESGILLPLQEAGQELCTPEQTELRSTIQSRHVQHQQACRQSCHGSQAPPPALRRENSRRGYQAKLTSLLAVDRRGRTRIIERASGSTQKSLPGSKFLHLQESCIAEWSIGTFTSRQNKQSVRRCNRLPDWMELTDLQLPSIMRVMRLGTTVNLTPLNHSAIALEFGIVAVNCL